MYFMKKFFILFSIISLFVCCKNEQTTFVYETVEIIEKNALYKDSVNWQSIKRNALKKAASIKTQKEAHTIIKDVLKELNDKHSFFVSKKRKNSVDNNQDRIVRIEHQIVNNDIGYVKIPSFSGNDSLSKVYVNTILEKIKKLDAIGIQHWIIDLRANRGGNMWAMLLGLSPFFGKQVIGYNARDSFYGSWSLKNDGIYYHDKKRLHHDTIYQLKNTPQKIAVLIGNETCSSGEAVAIAFIGMLNVRLFGSKTCGLSTSNSTISLKDDSYIYLTTMIFADRNKKIYGENIIPDVITSTPKVNAVRWLHSKEN